ncbi:MAG: hypothetical protein ABW212_07455 [Pseudonocardia sediminis]
MGEVVHECADLLFGTVTVAIDVGRGIVTVEGEALPTAVIERTAEVRHQPHVPLGTRDPDAVRLTVGGAREWVRPSRGRLSRRSYRVRARLGTADLLFTPSSPASSRLVRGTSYRGDNELGVAERITGGLVAVDWSPEVRALGATVPAASPSPAEAAVLYALASAFGTGARFLLGAMIEGAGDAATPW